MPTKVVKVACPHKCDNICNVTVPEGESINTISPNSSIGRASSYCDDCGNKFGISYQ